MAGTKTSALPSDETVTTLLGLNTVDGSPQTRKIAIEKVAAQIETLRGPKYATRAELYADLAWASGSEGRVYGDATTAYIGVYKKTGVAGSGSWTRIGDLPEGDVAALEAYADTSVAAARGLTHVLTIGGTANAITATSDRGNWTNVVGRMVRFAATATNTSTSVTIAVDGQTALAIKTLTGGNPPVGGIVAGQVYQGIVSAGPVMTVAQIMAPDDEAIAGTRRDLVMTPAAAKAAAEDRLGNFRAATLGAESGWMFAIEDALKKLALGINTAGKIWARLTDDSVVPESALPPATVAKLLQGGLGSGAIVDESGWSFALADAAGKVGFGLKTDGTFWAKLASDIGLPSGVSSAIISSVLSMLLPSTTITWWGDSLTQGAGGGGTTVTSVLAAALGRTVNNRGIGGQDSISIAIRSGSKPLTVTVSGNTIPASGAVAITAKNANILYSGGTYTGTVHVSIGGVPGVISTDSSGNWTFTRDTAGSDVSVAAGVTATIDAGTSFIPDPSVRRADTTIIWAGRNDSRANRAAITATRDTILAMIDYLSPLSKRVLVLGILNTSSETTGTDAYNGIVAANKELAANLGDRFIDIRRYLIDFGLADAGLTATDQDLTDIANDVVPSQLRVDSIHLTGAGYTLVGNFVARNIRVRGW